MTLTIVGMGPGSRDYLLPAAERAIQEADVLIGAPRLLALFPRKEGMPLAGPIDAILDLIEQQKRTRRVAVLVSGDPGLFSLQSAVRERFGPREYDVVPGLSSFQLACARTRVSWEGMRFVSVHGRKLEELDRVEPGARAVIFADRTHNPRLIAAALRARHGGARRCIVAEEVGDPGERVVDADLDAVSQMDFGGTSVVILP